MSTEVAQPDFDNIEAEPEAASEDAPKNKRKLIIIGAAAVVLLGLLGGGGYYFLGSGDGTGVSACRQQGRDRPGSVSI